MEITIEIPDDRLVQAMESARIGYWCALYEVFDTSGFKEGLFNKFKLVMNGWGRIQYKPLDEGLWYSMTQTTLRNGVRLAALKHPKVFSAIMEGNADSNDGDILIQLALFGEVRYG